MTRRRRAELNEAVHELRRPLQALALTAAGSAEVEQSVQLAAAALERLDREINGGATADARAPLRVRPLLESAVGRWRRRADLAGGSLELRWRAGDPVVHGDRCGMLQALDNLVLNAIEHGGSRIVVEATSDGAGVRVAVVDSGSARRQRRLAPARPFTRLRGRSRRGHGLRVVRRTAAAHGGSFDLRRSGTGTEAVLELPLLAAAA
ncbi:MAG TPA: HAMP domain-containing sensor histidine kinase [Solirubrobacterales bacterium]|jgi:signal transduction histidine kinase|nr:HAMP domain-containing sensor histidine kinase [Solirubrobacterales bacterium]